MFCIALSADLRPGSALTLKGHSNSHGRCLPPAERFVFQTCVVQALRSVLISCPLTRTNAVALKDTVVTEEGGGGVLIIIIPVCLVRGVLTPFSRHITSHPPGSRFSTELRDEINR